MVHPALIVSMRGGDVHRAAPDSTDDVRPIARVPETALELIPSPLADFGRALDSSNC